MKPIITFFISFILCGALLNGQTNLLLTSSEAEQVLLGNYMPTTYQASTVIDHPGDFTQMIRQEVSPDSLKKLVERIVSFGNRNTGSDTVSNVRGFGAARRWVHSYFDQLSGQRDNRLLPAYLQFDRSTCGMAQHRNIIAVLPGTDLADPGILLIEGHMDSRCEDVCDINCVAEGAEDNASGTALVMELARVMSTFTFQHTVVFMVTTGEEQGLLGAEAFARYAQQNSIPIKAVLNNDVIGGVICGATSSPPSCNGPDEIDSLQVRLFSDGDFNSPHKQLCRFIRLQYEEELMPQVTVPMAITLMLPEDRTGRGGDHIPFREKGYTAMRFTSANEHGNANPTPNYHDRQHSTRDILGEDTNNDGTIDSFYVDFNYLARNTRINGVAASLAAINPNPPQDFVVREASPGQLVVGISDPTRAGKYRVGVRSTSQYWDTVFVMERFPPVDTFTVSTSGDHVVSVAIFDTNRVESFFTEEKRIMLTTGLHDKFIPTSSIQLLPAQPNPFDASTVIGIQVTDPLKYHHAVVKITDLRGKMVRKVDFELSAGIKKQVFRRRILVPGIYFYTLYLNGEAVETRKMVVGK